MLSKRPKFCSVFYQKHPGAWAEDLRHHKRQLQEIIDPLKRWIYICCNDVASTMCEPLARYCRFAGLEIEKPKLDFGEIVRLLSGEIAAKPEEVVEDDVLPF